MSRSGAHGRLIAGPGAVPKPRAALLVGIHGAVVAYALYELSHAAEGIFAAGSMMLAMSAAAVTIGLVIAVAVDGWADRDPDPRTEGTRPCACCGAALARMGPLMVCPICDRLPISGPSNVAEDSDRR